MYSDRTLTDKRHPRQNLPDKRPSDQTPGHKPPRTIETEFVQGGFCPVIFVLGLLNVEGPRCVTYFREGVPGCVTMCDRGRGVKMAKNDVTYFMDGPSGDGRGSRNTLGSAVSVEWLCRRD